MAQIVLAVGGSVAAYKACDLASKHVQANHAVDVLLTRAAQWFVSPLAFAAITHRPVFTDETWRLGEGPAQHLAATRDAELLIVAPCTANLIGKFANGIADELVSASYLGARCAVLVAPAMNGRMWEHPAVTRNMERLRADGVEHVGPEEGRLAEAEQGLGRLTDPAGILAAAERLLSRR